MEPIDAVRAPDPMRIDPVSPCVDLPYKEQPQSLTASVPVEVASSTVCVSDWWVGEPRTEAGLLLLLGGLIGLATYKLLCFAFQSEDEDD